MIVEVDEKTALMTEKELEALPEYSLSLPTGTTIGKRWKRQKYRSTGIPVNDFGYDKQGYFVMEKDGWLMGEYAEDNTPPDRLHPNGWVRIIWRNVIVC
jgi:hypothetical protein